MGSVIRFARWGFLLRSALLSAVAVVALAPATASAAPRFVYVSNGFPAGSDDVSALRINSNGTLTPVAGSPFDTPGQTVTEGITMSPDARNVYVAHFGTNNISQFTVNANGGLSPVAGSATDPAGTNANGVNVLGVAPDPDGDHIFGWNHGSAIAVLSRNQATGALTNIAGSSFAVPATQINPFAGSVAPDGDHLYVENENSSELVAGCGGTCEVNRVTSYSVAANGQPTPIQGAGVITGSTNVNASGPNPFGSAITPDGNFLYVSNPEDGANGTISGFAVNANGTLSNQLFNLNTSPGNHPLNMAVSPDGAHLYVATRISRTVNAYTINANGTLTPVPGQPFATGAADVNGKGIAMTPDGKRLYVSAGGTDDRVFGFNVAANGALTQINATGFPTGGQDPDLESIAITPNQAPIASFTVDPAPAGQATGFDAGASTDVDNTGPRYDWNFGDGTTLADGGPVPNHIYAAPGSFTATLTLTDKEGCSTARIFTGKAMLCNGSPGATITSTVTVPPATNPQTPPPNSFARTLSIAYKKKDALFKGRIDSEKPSCERNQTVELRKKRKGRPDKRVGSDLTDRAGQWLINKKNAKGRFYAAVQQTALANGDTCLAATSRTVRVKKKRN